MRVKKRNDSIQIFDINKVKRCLLMAFNAEDVEPPDINMLVKNIAFDLVMFDDPMPVDKIQDAIESRLMESGFSDVARGYIIYRNDRDRARNRRLIPDPLAISDYIHADKYAKYIPSLGRREVYSETVNRVMNMHIRRWPALADKIRGLYTFVQDKWVVPSMRNMQFGGVAVEAVNVRSYNCAGTLVDRLRVFQEIFYLLLCGCGVGYSVQWEHVEQLPALGIVDTKRVYHHTIADTVEGWADAIGALIQGAIEGYIVEFNYSLIRPVGSELKTSGGKAPGHLGLKRCLEEVRKILSSCSGRKMRPIECHDIICHIAEAVLSGGIRRSSLMCLFSPTDTEMMYCKSAGVFSPGGLNHQRMMANNSVFLIRGATGNREIFERVNRISTENFGDPGFYFSNHRDYTGNPCCEICFNSTIQESTGVSSTGVSFCNLTEVNMARISSVGEFLDACHAASAIGTLQAAYTRFPYLGRVTERIAERDRLLGVSLTGMADNPTLAFDPLTLQNGVDIVSATNEYWADLLGISPAARLTTVKPSGTASLELGCIGSGIHPHHSKRYFRRVTANPNDPVAREFNRVNPHMIEIKPNGDWCITFPVLAPPDAVTIKTSSGLDLVKRVMLVYENWVKPGTRDLSGGLTNNVSATIHLRDDELVAYSKLVWDNQDSLTALSTVPVILDKKYPYAPREEVTSMDEDRWNYLISNYKPIDWESFNETTDSTNRQLEAACSGGVCDL